MWKSFLSKIGMFWGPVTSWNYEGYWVPCLQYFTHTHTPCTYTLKLIVTKIPPFQLMAWLTSSITTCTMFWSQISIIWTQIPWQQYFSTPFVDWPISEDKPDRVAMFSSWGGRHFITLFGRKHNLKLMIVYFWIFFFIFRQQWMLAMGVSERETPSKDS